MATKKQTSDPESTAAPKTSAANGKAGTTKKPAAEKAAPPAEPVAAADAPKTTAKKAAAPKAPKPADESAANGVAAVNGAAPAKAKAKASPAASTSASVVMVFGEVEVSGGTFFLHKGSVPEGQLQLVIDKAKKQLSDRIPHYSGQFVTVLGEYGKAKKTDKHPTFMVRNLASHDEIARRAYELSHENPLTVHDNWLRAENELLNG